jgi:hypothetical protein
MFLLHLFTERPFSDPHFSCLLPLGLLPPGGPPALCPSLPWSFSLVTFLLANSLVLLFYLYFIICEYIFSCPQLSFVFLFSSSASCITCFPAHSTQTCVPFCLDLRSSLHHPISVSVLSSVLALTHLPWWWGQQFPLKYQYMSARLHGIHAKTNVFRKYFICTLYVLRIFLHSHVICKSVHSAIRRNT